MHNKKVINTKVLLSFNICFSVYVFFIRLGRNLCINIKYKSDREMVNVVGDAEGFKNKSN